MGFTESQARRGLRETNNDVERALDWLFNHPGEEDDVAPAEGIYLYNHLSLSLYIYIYISIGICFDLF